MVSIIPIKNKMNQVQFVAYQMWNITTYIQNKTRYNNINIQIGKWPFLNVLFCSIHFSFTIKMSSLIHHSHLHAIFHDKLTPKLFKREMIISASTKCTLCILRFCLFVCVWMNYGEYSFFSFLFLWVNFDLWSLYAIISALTLVRFVRVRSKKWWEMKKVVKYILLMLRFIIDDRFESVRFVCIFYVWTEIKESHLFVIGIFWRNGWPCVYARPTTGRPTTDSGPVKEEIASCSESDQLEWKANQL